MSLLLIAGCASAPPAVDLESSPTFDGLYEVKGGQADEAWARPDVDISQYSKIMLKGVGIEYRPGGERGTTWAARSSGGPYEVTERQKERLRTIAEEEFLEELGKSEHFSIVDEAGPDVLLVAGKLLDVVSYVPPETAGRTDVYLREVGAATLVLELRDSITGTILVRAVDRRAAENLGMGLQESNRVTNTAEVRRLFAGWARLLRERLDDYGGSD